MADQECDPGKRWWTLSVLCPPPAPASSSQLQWIVDAYDLVFAGGGPKPTVEVGFGTSGLSIRSSTGVGAPMIAG